MRNKVKTGMGRALLALAALAGLLAGRAPAAGPEVKRPFMIWTAEDVQRIGVKIKSEPWARQKLERLLKEAPDPNGRAILENYFLYLVTGDKEAEKFEKQVMLHFAEVMASPKYAAGRSVEISASFRICNYDLGFRYDLFRGALSAEEVRVCDSKLNAWSSEQLKTDWSHQGGWEGAYGLFNSLTAVATGDKRLVRAAFAAPSGPKGYFDGMVDGYFSQRGCNPSPNALGAMWLWCRGVERLGLDELGFGYVGAGGGTMRRLLEGYFIVGDPRIDIPGGVPFYGRSAMTLGERLRRAKFFEMPAALASPTLGSESAGAGGARIALPKCEHPRDVFRTPLIVGRLRGATGDWPELLPFRNELFYSYDKKPRDLVGMPQIEYNRGTDPVSLGMQLPLVLELAHQRWPEAGFDYFLCRMRPPEDGMYFPSLLWGLDPIRVADTKGPAAKSTVLGQLGMALLRVEEGPAYWESQAPFVALRLTDGMGEEMPGSALSLHSLQAFNRPIYYYVHPPRGVPPLGESGAAHNTVVVDNGKRLGVGMGTVRQRLGPGVKFVAVRSAAPPPLPPAPPPPPPPTTTQPTRPVIPPPPASALPIAPGVEMERAVALTGEYLLDVFAVSGDTEHTYDWMVHALGSAAPERTGDWQPTTALDATLATTQDQHVGSFDQRFTYRMTYPYGEQHMLDAKGANWSLIAVQTTTAEDANQTVMGPEWYARKVGVRLTMLGEAGTRAFHAREVLPRRLTEQESAQLEEIRFPKRLKGRDTRYDKADHERTEIAIPPEDDGGGAAAAASKPSAKDFRPVGQAAGGPPETGGVAIVAERRAARTMFVALHEPFEKMAWKIGQFRRIQQTDDAVAVAVRGAAPSSVDDRVMVRMGARANEPVTLSDGAEQFTFRSFAYVRVGAGQVTAAGDLTAMKVKAGSATKLVVNGKETKADVRDGWMTLAP
jgi:hypothetical protein